MLARTCLGAFAALLLSGLASHARADAIDGSWCAEPDLRVTINGPTIVTPGGHPLWGDYSRHNFSYTVPQGEPGAGAVIQMRLLSEYTMQSRSGTDEATVQTWHRCSPATS